MYLLLLEYYVKRITQYGNRRAQRWPPCREESGPAHDFWPLTPLPPVKQAAAQNAKSAIRGSGSRRARGVASAKRAIVMKRLAAFVSQELHALVAHVKQGLLLMNIGNKSYSHSFLEPTMSSDADRAALLFRVLSQP